MVSSDVLSINFNQFSKEYYHGTTSSNYASLMSGVSISKCAEFTDFGKGFYLTSNFRQASKHAEKRSSDKDDPIVFVYTLNISVLKEEYQGNILNRMNLEWAEFIYNNRTMMKKFIHSYDYVQGGVADGAIFDLVQAVDQGLDIQHFYEQIAKYSTYNQLSIHNQDIFTYNVLKLSEVVNAFGKNEKYVQGEIIVPSEL